MPKTVKKYEDAMDKLLSNAREPVMQRPASMALPFKSGLELRGAIYYCSGCLRRLGDAAGRETRMPHPAECRKKMNDARSRDKKPGVRTDMAGDAARADRTAGCLAKNGGPAAEFGDWWDAPGAEEHSVRHRVQDADTRLIGARGVCT